MPIQHYSLFKGWVVERQLATFKNPHYHIHAVDQLDDYRISVNVYSDIPFRKAKANCQVEYCVVADFVHPITARLEQLEPGIYPLNREPDNSSEGLALDYSRINLFDRAKLQPAPYNLPGRGLQKDLNEILEYHIKSVLGDKKSLIYAFGSLRDQPNQHDKIFGFRAGKSLSNIHMNQGNSPEVFEEDNGVWQDGAILIHCGQEKRWVGYFIKFQHQCWDTWDDTGAPKYKLDRHFTFLRKKEKNRKKAIPWDGSFNRNSGPSN